MVDDVYLDDNERAERVKQWWKENGLSIVGGAALGLVAIFGWRAWQANQQAQAESAAMAYRSFEQQAQSLSVEEIAQQMELFRTEFAGTPYDALAALEGALLYYRAGEMGRAEELYGYAIDNGDPVELRDVARLRLARLALDQGRFEVALTALDNVESEGFGGLSNELRGDVLARMGRVDEARQAYQAAQDSQSGNTSQFLDLKIASLGSGILAGGEGEANPAGTAAPAANAGDAEPQGGEGS